MPNKSTFILVALSLLFIAWLFRYDAATTAANAYRLDRWTGEVTKIEPTFDSRPSLGFQPKEEPIPENMKGLSLFKDAK